MFEGSRFELDEKGILDGDGADSGSTPAKNVVV